MIYFKTNWKRGISLKKNSKFILIISIRMFIRKFLEPSAGIGSFIQSLCGERGSDAFIIVPVNTGLYAILLRTGSLDFQGLKSLSCKDNKL